MTCYCCGKEILDRPERVMLLQSTLGFKPFCDLECLRSWLPDRSQTAGRDEPKTAEPEPEYVVVPMQRLVAIVGESPTDLVRTLNIRAVFTTPKDR